MKREQEKIRKILTDYKTVVDKACEVKKANEQKHAALLESQKSKYTKEYLAEMERKFKEGQHSVYYPPIDRARATAKKEINGLFEQMENELESMVNAPANSDFLNKLNALKISGITPSKKEFELLYKDCSSYMELRLLNELNKGRITEQGNSVNFAELQFLVDCPDIDQLYKTFEDYKERVNITLDSYNGQNSELFADNPRYQDYYRVVDGKTEKIKDDESYVAESSYSIKFFLDDFKELKPFEDQLNKGLYIPKNNRPLSTQETKLINELTEFDKYPSTANKRAVQIAKVDNGMAALFMRDSRFADDVKAALAE